MGSMGVDGGDDTIITSFIGGMKRPLSGTKLRSLTVEDSSDSLDTESDIEILSADSI